MEDRSVHRLNFDRLCNGLGTDWPRDDPNKWGGIFRKRCATAMSVSVD